MNIPKVTILQNNVNTQFTTVTRLHYDVFDIVHYVVSLVEYVSVDCQYNIINLRKTYLYLKYFRRYTFSHHSSE